MRVVPHRSHNEVRWIGVRDLRQGRVEDEFHYKYHQPSALISTQNCRRLAGTVDPRDQEEAIRRQTRRSILEVADRPRRVIQPRINSNTSLRREREREVLA